MTACERCGAEVTRWPASTGHASTRTTSPSRRGAWYHGRLCVACWRQLTAFLAGEPAEPAPDRRREVDA